MEFAPDCHGLRREVNFARDVDRVPRCTLVAPPSALVPGDPRRLPCPSQGHEVAPRCHGAVRRDFFFLLRHDGEGVAGTTGNDVDVGQDADRVPHVPLRGRHLHRCRAALVRAPATAGPSGYGSGSAGKPFTT